MKVRANLLLATTAASLMAGIILVGTAQPYVTQGRPWPGGLVRYYNAAPDQAWAVQRAVAAWNSSGAGVRLVAVPASEADVRIEHFPRVTCTINAEATIGYTRSGRIWIFRRDDASPYCNRYMAAQALAHEFGHVLGLGHETRGCAAMNPVGSLQGPELCPFARPWQWRCRLLTSDDVAGAVALYGGAETAMRGTADCDLYRAAGAPSGLAVTPTTTPHHFLVTFRRPPSSRVPGFLFAEGRRSESFVAAASSRTCPADARAYRQHLWSAAVGEPQQTSMVLPAGTSCISVWAVDSLNRPSDRPAVLSIRVVETA